MRKNFSILQSLIPLLGLALIVSLAFFALPWADDFCNLDLMTRHNPFSYAWRFYNEWDGRLFTFFIQGVFLQSTFLGIISIYVWILFFFLCVLIVLKAVLKPGSKLNLWMFFLLSIVFWLGFRRHISETIYWSTGGGYMLASLIGLLWLYLYERIELKNSLQLSTWALFSLVAGLNSFSLAPALMTYMFYPKIRSVFSSKSIKPIQDKKFFVSMIMVLVGAIVISIAPGNFARATEASEAFKGFVLLNLLSVNFKFLLFGWPLIPLSAIFAYIHRADIASSNKDKQIQWLLTALATAAPLAILNGFSSPRTAIFFHFFITVFFIFFFKGVLDSLSKNDKLSLSFKAATTVAFFVLITVDLNKGYHFYVEYRDQLQYLKEVKGSKQAISLKRTLSPPRSLQIRDLSDNPADWSNVCAADYYKVESIVLLRD